MPPENISEADFRTLGLDPGSEQSEVRQAYRTLAKRWHPDRHHSKPFEIRALAEERFKRINEAYRRISSARKRQAAFSDKIRTAQPEQAGPAGTFETKPGPDRILKRKPAEIRLNRAGPIFVLFILLVGLGYQIFLLFPEPSVEIQKIPPRIYPADRETPDAEDLQSLDSKSITERLAELSKPAPSLSNPLLQSREPAKPYFTVGSTSKEVLLVQGTPSRVQGQTWVYGLSEVQFKNGQVWKYNNFDGSLKVIMLPGTVADQDPPACITIGSTQDEVLLVQGTPTRVEQDKWFYGFAEIRFKDGRLREYDNHFGTLKMRLVPSVPAGPDGKKTYFTVGSTPDEVLALQGTPTSVHGNLWSFNFSSVFFRDGRVQYVTDSDGTLLFLPREEPGVRSGS
jgi:hypothetical protein